MGKGYSFFSGVDGMERQLEKARAEFARKVVYCPFCKDMVKDCPHEIHIALLSDGEFELWNTHLSEISNCLYCDSRATTLVAGAMLCDEHSRIRMLEIKLRTW